MAYVNTIERYERRIAREEGLREGLQEGAMSILKKLIQLKFGALPDWAQQRLEEASQEQLTDWAGAILSAENLETMLN